MQGLLQYSICVGFRWIIVDMGYTNLSGRWFCYCIRTKPHPWLHLPNSGASAKMISITAPGATPTPSYFVLSSDNNLYAVGENSFRQLETGQLLIGQVGFQIYKFFWPSYEQHKMDCCQWKWYRWIHFRQLTYWRQELKFITGAKMVIQC